MDGKQGGPVGCSKREEEGRWVQGIGMVVPLRRGISKVRTIEMVRRIASRESVPVLAHKFSKMWE